MEMALVGKVLVSASMEIEFISKDPCKKLNMAESVVILPQGN